MAPLLRPVGHTHGAQDGTIVRRQDQCATAPGDEDVIDFACGRNVRHAPAFASLSRRPDARATLDAAERDGVLFESDSGDSLVVRGFDTGRLGAVHGDRGELHAVGVDDAIATGARLSLDARFRRQPWISNAWTSPGVVMVRM